MQKLYWRPAHVSRVVHVLVAVIAGTVLIGAERFQVVTVQPDFDVKLQAAKRMQRGMDVVHTYRVRNVSADDPELDPARSGMIGLASSATTTNTGSLEAKRTTANPNWAAVMVDLLRSAGVERGDLVALGVSGSFPALNLAAFVAIDVLEVEGVSIASAGASSFGANIAGLGWLDMERILADADVITTRSIAASLGGTSDRGLGMDRSGRRRLRESIERNRVRFIEVKEEISSIEQRMQLYEESANGRRFAAYINAGGSLVSLGPKEVKYLYRPGVNLRPHPRGLHMDSVMMRFLTQGVPVINLSKVLPLAEQYGLPVDPLEMPKPGEGPVFEKRSHNRPLVAGLLVLLIGVTWSLLRLELGARLVELGGGRRRKIERMV